MRVASVLLLCITHSARSQTCGAGASTGPCMNGACPGGGTCLKNLPLPVCCPPGKVVPAAPATPTAAQLVPVSYYYNYAHGVHAFCADQTCISVIQKNGIGYDMRNGKGVMGRAVSDAAIATVRKNCPAGAASLVNLGFTKSGKKYLHNLAGNGLKQGWVSTVQGACGATVPIKRWKSRFTDDMMYGVNLEWNTWYKGMVQDGGRVQFYMWA